MIIKSFSFNELKKNQSNFYLLYGENEGHKEEVINKYILKEFDGEIIKYEESQILENKNDFFETCLNESLFNSKKIVLISRVSSKLYETINELLEKKLFDKKIIFNAGSLEKKSRIRQLFEKEKKLVCIPFYKDNNASLFRLASDFFKINKISISSQNINLIIEKCSGDRKNLQNEMNKILNFCLEGNKISREELLKLINLYDDQNYFELIDNCLSKNHMKVVSIINDKIFSTSEAIILIRSFLSRIKRLIELKKLQKKVGDTKKTVNDFKPPIFWKDKAMVERQIEIWSTKKIYELLDEINTLEISYKKNSSISNNLIFDFILNTSNN